MRRIVAAFDDPADVPEATHALREAGFEPSEPDIDNPFFDPATTMPEGRGLVWGGLLGGLIGAVLLFMMDQNVYWIPRVSPIMTAGQYMLVFLGFGLGATIGGFLGGVIGTTRHVSTQDQPRVAIMVPDNRVDETEEILRDHGASAVDGTVTHHDHPQRAQMTEPSASRD